MLNEKMILYIAQEGHGNFCLLRCLIPTSLYSHTLGVRDKKLEIVQG